MVDEPVALLLFVLTAIATRFFTAHGNWSDEAAARATAAVLLSPVPVMVVMAAWSWARRRSRTAKMAEERDATVPNLQRQLNEVESELQRLSR